MAKSQSDWSTVLDLIRRRPYVSDLREQYISRLDEIESERDKQGLFTPSRPDWAARCRPEAVGLYHWTVGDLADLWTQDAGILPDAQAQGAIAELVRFARTGQVDAPLTDSLATLCQLVGFDTCPLLASDWWLGSPFPTFAIQSDGLERNQMALEATRVLVAAVLARARLAADLRVPVSWASALAGVPTTWGLRAILGPRPPGLGTGGSMEATLVDARTAIRWLKERGLSGLSPRRLPSESPGRPRP